MTTPADTSPALDWSLRGVQVLTPAADLVGVDAVLRAAFQVRADQVEAARTALASLRPDQLRVLSSAGEIVSQGPQASISLLVQHATIATPQVAGPEALTCDIPLKLSLPPRPPMSDPPPYVLQLLDVAGLSPDQAWAGFILTAAAAPRRAPPAPAAAAPAPSPEPDAAPAIDYLARDFDGLTALMIGRLTAHLPADAGARLTAPADPLRTVVEALAAAGDYLSYHQDAVGTEASLDTARWRLSVQRHARLLDYVVHDGCNARTWLALEVSADLLLPAGACAVSTQAMALHPQLPADYPLDPQGTIAFETMQPTRLFKALNDLGPALQRAAAYTLPQGACWAILAGAQPQLSAGRTLVFEQRHAPGGAAAFGAHAVKLIYVGQVPDTSAPAGAAPAILTVVGWHPEDALPRNLVVPPSSDSGVALYGNTVLADHGLSVKDPAALSWRTAPSGASRLTVRTQALTYASAPPEAPMQARPRLPTQAAAVFPSARASLLQDPVHAAPGITLTDQTGGAWRCRRDLFGANPTTRAFVAEPGEGFGDPPAMTAPAVLDLRFGDGVLGRLAPSQPQFDCIWRSGSGTAGNINAGVLTQIVVDAPDGAVTAVHNPLPAVGGTAAAPTRYGRLLAPTAYRDQRRGVTAGDLVELALQDPLVTDAAAQPAQDGGRGFRVWVAVRGPEGLELPVVTRRLKRFELIGAPLHVALPRRIGVDVALTAHVSSAAEAAGVSARLTQDFGTGLAVDGSPAFFNPVNWRLGQPLTLSALITAMLADRRIDRVETDPRADPRLRFALWSASGENPRSGFADGRLQAGPGDILGAAGDPSRPSRGRIAFFVVVDEP
jgi:hypothetical protein